MASEFETVQVGEECEENPVAPGPSLDLDHDACCEAGIVDEKNGNAYFSDAELEESVISRGSGERECKYRQLG